MRHTYVLGNWKQNHLRAEAAATAQGIAEGLAQATAGALHLSAGVAPTFVALDVVRPHCRLGTGASGLALLAQDVGAQESGAFTGEVGPAMLKDAGVFAAIVGHSERRAKYGDDAMVADKVAACLAADLHVVLCCGESLEQRDAGEHENVVISQLSEALSKVENEAIDPRVVFAYEPVWAIGTGRTASPEQASEMHGAIRAWLRESYGNAGEARSILYGGSVKPANAGALITAPDIDGFLVGGASLDAGSFLDIVRAAAAARQA